MPAEREAGMWRQLEGREAALAGGDAPPRGPRSRAPGGGGGGGRGPRLAWRPALNEATGCAAA